MNSFLYLYKTTTKNKLKKAMRRPVSYLYLLLIIGYVVLIFGTFGGMAKDLGVNTPDGLAALLTVFAFFIIPANMISYCRKKGLIFTRSDVHLLFPAPVNPKHVLLYAQVKQVIFNFLIGVFLVVAGCLWFEVTIWRMLLYFLFAQLIENVLEGSIMLILYGSEKLTQTMLNGIRVVMYACISLFFVIGLILLATKGFSIDSIMGYFSSQWVQMVPLIGWNIAVIHLIIVAPTVVNVICSALYLISAVVLFGVAYKMECSGEYYEDAIKFAEDYAVAREKGKKGQMAFIGKKEKFQKANVVYKGHYAKALFYRQLLEYKKNKFFIFGINSIICVGAVVLIYFMGTDPDLATSPYRPFLIPGILAYICFIFSGYPTKWSKEMNSPYTYLIPDTAFHKLWYATQIEHVRSIIDGALFAIPAAIIIKVTPVQAALSILIYICLQASKLYGTVMMESLLGSILGNTAKLLFRMLLMGVLIGFGVLGAVLGTLWFNIEIGYLFMIIIVAVMTFVFMLVAAGAFEKMEAVD